MNKFDYADVMPILDENTMRSKRRTNVSELKDEHHGKMLNIYIYFWSCKEK